MMQAGKSVKEPCKNIRKVRQSTYGRYEQPVEHAGHDVPDGSDRYDLQQDRRDYERGQELPDEADNQPFYSLQHGSRFPECGSFHVVSDG